MWFLQSLVFSPTKMWNSARIIHIYNGIDAGWQKVYKQFVWRVLCFLLVWNGFRPNVQYTKAYISECILAIHFNEIYLLSALQQLLFMNLIKVNFLNFKIWYIDMSVTIITFNRYMRERERERETERQRERW
jgi:hypothetical protein